MKRVEPLIDLVRQITGNTRYDANSGISQSVMALYLNSAQDEIMKAMVNAKTKYLQKEIVIPVVNAQQEYSYPEDIFMQNIDTMQWTMDNLTFSPLVRGYTKYKFNNQAAYAFGYYTKNSGFVLTPPVTQGNLHLNYMRKLPRMAIRSGMISALTIGSGNLTALTVATTGTYNAAEIASDNFLTIVDYLGNVKLSGVQYSSETAGVFTIVSTEITGATPAIGDYIVIGKYASNIAELPDIAEGFLLLYAEYRVKYGDASKWTAATKDNLALVMQTIIDSINSNNDDTNEVLITNYDYLNLG